ncbi:MAG: helix-hairpin-helix domain-containing protein [Verrucomicrobiota bacterium]
MQLRFKHRQQGIALVIVMIVITFLSILVAGFSYSMKVETKLARNAIYDPEMEWLGRSGIELAKYVLGQQRNIAGENNYDSLNQKWAGGPGNSNSVIADVQMDNVPLGRGSFSVKITDCERKFNVNVADEMILQQALLIMGADPSEFTTVVNSILDWIDPDDTPRTGGTESDYYEGLNPPYSAKNGPVDDMNELLLVRGVTPEMFWGPRYSGPPSVNMFSRSRHGLRERERPAYTTGLVDLFTPFGSRGINLNTASATALQVIPEIDENTAAEIIKRRAGPDGADGTLDDMPYRSPGELASVPGISPALVGQISRFFVVQSTTFEVEVTVSLDGRTRKFFAILRRLDTKNVQVLTMYWK